MTTDWGIVATLSGATACGLLFTSAYFRGERAVLLVSLLIEFLIVGPFSPPDDGRWSLHLLIVFCVWNILLWGVYKAIGERLERRGIVGNSLRFGVLLVPICLAITYGMLAM